MEAQPCARRRARTPSGERQWAAITNALRGEGVERRAEAPPDVFDRLCVVDTGPPDVAHAAAEVRSMDNLTADPKVCWVAGMTTPASK